jgi:hypothetical protein
MRWFGRWADPRLRARHQNVEQHAAERYAEAERVVHLDHLLTADGTITCQRMLGGGRTGIGPVDRIRRRTVRHVRDVL